MKKIAFVLFLITTTLRGFGQQVTVPTLTTLPEELHRSRIDLNGTWNFDVAPAADFWKSGKGASPKPIQVPGEWVMQGFEVKKGAYAGYARTFSVPADYKGKRLKLRANGVFSESNIYINGQQVGSHIGGFTAFEFDITDFVNLGKPNLIAIQVRSESLADSLASASKYAVHPLGGITRDIYIFPVNAAHVSAFHVTTDFDATYSDAVLSAAVEFANESTETRGNLSVAFTLLDPAGRPVALQQGTRTLSGIQAKGRLAQQFDFTIARPTHWTSESPALYTLQCVLSDGKNVVHRTQRKVGFRELEVRGNQFLVNGKPIKLRGVNRHEVMPLRGRSMADDIWLRDVQLFREANVNYIRTSHYPPDERLLEVCDSLGMFVEVEAPFCWAHETNVPEEKMYSLLVNQHIEMVNRDKSHPSVIMWSLGNESNKYAEYFKRAGEVIKQIDPSRPRIFSQWGPEADNGELEVTNHHYPGPTGPEKYRHSKRPVVFDEYIHVNSYNRFELAADPGVRNMWGPMLDRMWTDMYNSRGVLGGAIWAGIDDTFFLPNEKVVGYGTWGPLDGWRREKPEYWNMKKAYSPVRIQQVSNRETDGRVRFVVENRHNFTNLSACKIAWTYGAKSGTVGLDVAARASGDFEILLPQETAGNELLKVVVSSPLGFVIDVYQFTVVPEIIRVTRQASAVSSVTVEEQPTAVVVRAGKNTYVWNKDNGQLHTQDTKGQTMLQAGPTLMLLPLNSEGRGIQMVGTDQNFEPFNPRCTQWVCTGVTVSHLPNGVEVLVAGRYHEAHGSYRYRVEGDKPLQVDYDFEVSTAVSPRQVGLVFDVSPFLNKTYWKRMGYWNYYPVDHLGSLAGETASLRTAGEFSGSAGPSKQPSWLWSFDQNTAGTNLFRATKEHISSAGLVDAANEGVHVLSDGKQHFRAWLEGGVIRMLVADYNNGGREGFLSSHAELDYKPLKRGDVVRGTIRMNIGTR